MSGLEKCPRLRKLWLFQNYIPSISGIQQCPELIELMLQNNHVEYLTGLEHNHKIETLNLAGNPVSDIYETKRLSSLQHLSNLSFCDVHFGKCPIFDEDGYNEFIILNLRQIQNLDGVIISEAKINVAENTIIQRRMEETLKLIENDYQTVFNELVRFSNINRRMYENLEKELLISLGILEELVSDSHKMINQQLRKHQFLFDCNFEAFTQRLQGISQFILSILHNSVDKIHMSHDLAASYIYICECISRADSTLQSIFKTIDESSPRSLLFTPVMRESSVFNQIAQSLGFHRNKDHEVIPAGFRRKLIHSSVASLNMTELVKLYQLHPLHSVQHDSNYINQDTDPINLPLLNAFTLISPVTLVYLLRLVTQSSDHNHYVNADDGGQELRSKSIQNLLFFSHPDIATMILSADKQDYRNKPSSLEYQNKEDLLSSQPLLREAQRKVAMICLFCEIDINTLLGRNVSSNGNNNSKKVSDNRYERKVVIPSSEKGKEDLLKEIYLIKKPLSVTVELEEYQISSNVSSNRPIYVSLSTSNRPNNAITPDPSVTSRMFALPFHLIPQAILDGTFVIHYIGIVLTPTDADGVEDIKSKLEGVMSDISVTSRSNEIIQNLEISLRENYSNLLDNLRRDLPDSSYSLVDQIVSRQEKSKEFITTKDEININRNILDYKPKKCSNPSSVVRMLKPFHSKLGINNDNNNSKKIKSYRNRK